MIVRTDFVRLVPVAHRDPPKEKRVCLVPIKFFSNTWPQ